MRDKFFVEIKDYEFSSGTLKKIGDINFIKGCWPLVYILRDDESKIAYIGETTDALSRMGAHLRHSKKKILKTVKFIMSDRFNKSATLDIESNLIRYMSGDGEYQLLNGNVGISNHTYFQQRELYLEIFKTVWDELRRDGVAKSTLESIDNSDLFKYSPYKALTQEQKDGLIDIIKCLLIDSTSTVMVEGGAGTGKSILALYLFKLLYSDPDDLNFNDFGDDEFEYIRLVRELQIKYPKPRVGLVIPMSSFRTTIKGVFSKIHGLKASMVLGPAEVVRHRYDILIVDESHRLRRRVNLGAYFGAFDKANLKIGLSKNDGNELDWVIKQSDKQILFYDKNQSIKPSDVQSSCFEQISISPKTKNIKLKSQLRSLGGNDYVDYVDRLLSCRLRESDKVFSTNSYDFQMIDSFPEMVEIIFDRDKEFGLSRMVAGYAWKWVSQNNTDSDIFDIEIDGVKLRWNSTNSDWINSENAVKEVGCIHTTQGYDLNYVGVIFGNEITYDPIKEEIVIKRENYHDRNGRLSANSDDELKQFIINIYKTIMLRGIKGTYVYVCDTELRKYFSKFIPRVNETRFENTQRDTEYDKKLTISPYAKNLVSIPLYDSVGCGEFMYADSVNHETVEVPGWLIKPGAKYFALRTSGDSMDQLGIKHGDIILCQKNYQPSSGSNAVILIGDDATLKQIKFEKDALVLIPKSNNPTHKITRITADDDDFKILGVFVCKL